MIVIDARGWEPPRPFDVAMEAICNLAPGDEVRLIVDREPFPLYRALDRNSYAHFTTARDDGTFEVAIRARND
jgi:uncharacterized protein (DUF2249 family)